MKSLDQIAETLTNRVLVYGPPKVGKTRLVGALAEKFNLLYIDIENGKKTLRQLPADWQQRIFPLSIPDTRTYPIAAETCLALIKGQKGTICENHSKWNCQVCRKNGDPVEELELNILDSTWIVVLDSLTQLSNSVMAHLLRHEADTYKPEWGDYRNQGALLDRFLGHVQQAPFNVVCISHETETQMVDGKPKLVPVAGTTNFSRNTAKYFDDVVYCNVVNREHKFASASTWSTQILTGSRGNVEIESMGEASLLPFFDPAYIRERNKEKSEASAPAAQKSRLQEILAKAKAGKS